MRLIGCVLIALAGLWTGVTAARGLSAELDRCEEYVEMLALMELELGRFKTPLPELFSSLEARLGGAGAALCGRVAKACSDDAVFREIWQHEAEKLPPRERRILLPLGGVLGRFGAEEQAARIGQAREQMAALRQERASALADGRRLRVGVCAAGGLMLAVLMY